VLVTSFLGILPPITVTASSTRICPDKVTAASVPISLLSSTTLSPNTEDILLCQQLAATNDLRGMGNDTEDEDGFEMLICRADPLPVGSQVRRAATAEAATSSPSLSADHGVVRT
jgi:hypothetical protein